MVPRTLARPIRRTVLSLAAAAALTMAPGAPSAHAADGDPVIVSPAAGEVLPNQWEGPVIFDFSGALADSYSVSVHCEGDGRDANNFDSFGFDPATDDPVVRLWLDEIPEGPGTCTAQALGHNTGAFAERQWRLLGPSVQLLDVSVNRTTFFPVVRDGYQDTVTLEWFATVPAHHQVTVRGADGAIVRTIDLGMLEPHWNGMDYDQQQWTWDGRNGHARPVDPGEYTIELTAAAEDGKERTVSRTVTAATGMRDLGIKRQSRGGSQTTRVRVGRGCFAQYGFARANRVYFDCLHGRRLVATWRFVLPDGATRVKWIVRGSQMKGRPDVRISIPRSGNRATVRLVVPHRQAAFVNKVSLKYRIRIPI